MNINEALNMLAKDRAVCYFDLKIIGSMYLSKP